MSIPVATTAVVAAGAVCWRVVDGKTLVLIVHRGDRADVGLPKGKVDPGETPPQTAVRELKEETGLSVTLGAPLQTIQYTMPGGKEKVVHFWASEVSDAAVAASTFFPNAEIASVQWLPIAKARAALSYDRDRDVLDEFEARVKTGRARTFPIIALRHGKTIPRPSWDGPDATRPLMHRGREQAISVAPAIAAWSPRKLISSTALRCLSTIEPTAAVTGLPISLKEEISQDAFADDESGMLKLVHKRVAKRKPVVLCSHGPVIPHIVAEIAKATGEPDNRALRHAAELATGEYIVLHVSLDHPHDGLVAFETHTPHPG